MGESVVLTIFRVNAKNWCCQFGLPDTKPVFKTYGDTRVQAVVKAKEVVKSLRPDTDYVYELKDIETPEAYTTPVK
jgi:hypothetical protein